jgi:hypothetical protein
MENMRSTVPPKVGQDLEQYQIFCKKPEHRRAIGAVLIKKRRCSARPGWVTKVWHCAFKGVLG